jgi:hypothetical protein
MDFLHKIEAIIILDSEGLRIFSKYYPVPRGKAAAGGSAANEAMSEVSVGPWPTTDSQRRFEDSLHKKAVSQKGPAWSGADDDILLIDGHSVVFHSDPEVSFYVVGGGDENELALLSVLNCLVESLQQTLKLSGPIDKRSLFEGYEAILLIVDEMVDDSVILEASSANVVQDTQPFLEPVAGETARKALVNVAKYLKEQL